jgi:hypothetical protein
LGEPPQGRTMRHRCGCNRRAWHGLHHARSAARKKRPGRRLRAPAPAYSEGGEVGFFGKGHNHRFAIALENAGRGGASVEIRALRARSSRQSHRKTARQIGYSYPGRLQKAAGGRLLRIE